MPLTSTAIPKEFKTSVLKQDTHDSLVQDIDRIAQDANIRPRWIYTPLIDHVTENEYDWVKYFKMHDEQGNYGLVYGDVPKLDDRFSAIAGALVRNFIRCRIVTIEELVTNSPVQNFSCLIVNNFQIGNTQPPDWLVAGAIDALFYRKNQGKQTILHAIDLKQVTKIYGVGVSKLLAENYTAIHA